MFKMPNTLIPDEVLFAIMSHIHEAEENITLDMAFDDSDERIIATAKKCGLKRIQDPALEMASRAMLGPLLRMAIPGWRMDWQLEGQIVIEHRGNVWVQIRDREGRFEFACYTEIDDIAAQSFTAEERALLDELTYVGAVSAGSLSECAIHA